MNIPKLGCYLYVTIVFLYHLFKPGQLFNRFLSFTVKPITLVFSLIDFSLVFRCLITIFSCQSKQRQVSSFSVDFSLIGRCLITLFSFQSKQGQVSELLARADNYSTENRSQADVYAAMADTLGEAWKDLFAKLEYRGKLLQQSIAFQQSAQDVSKANIV